MIHRSIIIMATAAFILVSNAANAEFYQYTDDKGVVHYTDNFATIPEQYRSQIASHPEAATDTSPEKSPAIKDMENNEKEGAEDEAPWRSGIDQRLEMEKTEKTKRSQKQKADSSETTSENTDNQIDAQTAHFQKQRDRLIEEKDNLNKQYHSILKEKQKIESTRNQMEAEAEIEAYNSRIQELNKRIKKYRKQEKSLRSEIQKYNELIKKQKQQPGE